MDKHRDEFHPCRTVKSLEAHFYRLKRNGIFDDIDHFHGLTKNISATTKQSLDEAEDEIFNDVMEEEEEESVKNTKRNQEKKDAKVATKLERELSQDRSLPKKRKKKAATTKSQVKTEEPVPASAPAQTSSASEPYDSTYIFALLDGMHALLRITNEETLIGRQTQTNKVDIDLAAEGDAGKASRKQAIQKLLQFLHLM